MIEVLVAWLAIVIGSVLAIHRMSRLPSSRFPTANSNTRDQIIAQNRVISGGPAGPDDPMWDGQQRSPIPEGQSSGGGG